MDVPKQVQFALFKDIESQSGHVLRGRAPWLGVVAHALAPCQAPTKARELCTRYTVSHVPQHRDGRRAAAGAEARQSGI